MVMKLIFFPVGNSSFGNPESLSSKETPATKHSNEIQIQQAPTTTSKEVPATLH